MIAPKPLQTPGLARRFSQMMDEEGVTLADLLEELEAERKRSTDLPAADED